MEVTLSADGFLDLSAVLTSVRREGLSTLMVEGGGTVLASLIQAGLWDRAAITVVPRWIGGYRLPSDRIPDVSLQDVEWLAAGDDSLCLGWRTA